MKKILKNKKAQGLVEWIMILALILVAVIVVLKGIGGAAKEKGAAIQSALEEDNA